MQYILNEEEYKEYCELKKTTGNLSSAKLLYGVSNSCTLQLDKTMLNDIWSWFLGPGKNHTKFIHGNYLLSNSGTLKIDMIGTINELK